MRRSGRLFLSHSHKDRGLAEAFVDLFVGAGLAEDRIFFSSVRSTGIQSGRPVEQVLREELKNASAVVQLISRNYLSSPMCLMELGGAWVLELPAVPVVVPPLGRAEVTAAIGNFQMGQLSTPADIQSVSDDLYTRLSSLGVMPNQATWRRSTERFAASVRTHLGGASSDPAQAAVGGDEGEGGAPARKEHESQKAGSFTFSGCTMLPARRGFDLLVHIRNDSADRRSAVLRATFYKSSEPIASERTTLSALDAGDKKPVTFRAAPDHDAVVFSVDSEM